MNDDRESTVPLTASGDLGETTNRESSSIFIGRFGLRAGWGIAIYLILFAVFSTVLGFAVLAATGGLKDFVSRHAAPPANKAAALAAPAAQHSKHEMRPSEVFTSETLTFAALALAAFAVARVERRRVGVYGISLYRLHDVALGAFWGLAALSLLVGILRAFHLLVFDARLLYGRDVLRFGGKWLVAFLVVALVEEYLMRGYLQYTLARGFFAKGEPLSSAKARAVAFWTAAILMSLIFGALHLSNAGETPFGLFAVFVAGMVFSYALWRTGSLWWAIGFHMAWDWAQSFLYGVPDSGNLSAHRLFQTHPSGSVLLSGGADGPEGSVLVIPTLLLVALLIRFMQRGVQPALDPAHAANKLPDVHTVIA